MHLESRAESDAAFFAHALRAGQFCLCTVPESGGWGPEEPDTNIPWRVLHPLIARLQRGTRVDHLVDYVCNVLRCRQVGRIKVVYTGTSHLVARGVRRANQISPVSQHRRDLVNKRRRIGNPLRSSMNEHDEAARVRRRLALRERWY